MLCRNIPVFSTQCLSYHWYSKLFLLTISPLFFLPVSSFWAFFWFTLSTFFHICVFFSYLYNFFHPLLTHLSFLLWFTICCVLRAPPTTPSSDSPFPPSPHFLRHLPLSSHRHPDPGPTSMAGHGPDAQPRARRHGPVLRGLAGPPQQCVSARTELRPVGGLWLRLHLDQPQLQDGIGAAKELHLPSELENVQRRQAVL